MAKINLQTRAARARLTPRGKPYKVRLMPGVHLGYRAAQSRHRRMGGDRQRRQGRSMDRRASPTPTTSSRRTGRRCSITSRRRSRRERWPEAMPTPPADRPATIDEALTAYEADLTTRRANPYNARNVRFHLPAHLLAQPLPQVTAKQLRHWRDGLIAEGMLPATVNRVLKSAHAAFNLAAKLDKRVAANAQAWKIGLEALRGTVTARDAVLTDAQVLAVVAAAYDVSAAFGLYCQIHAETGARSSQLARLVVADLERDRLMVPVVA